MYCSSCGENIKEEDGYERAIFEYRKGKYVDLYFCKICMKNSESKRRKVYSYHYRQKDCRKKEVITKNNKLDTPFDVKYYISQCKSDYDSEVLLHYNNETGIWQWSVKFGETWIESFKTRKEAEKFCKDHNLKISKVINDKRKHGK